MTTNTLAKMSPKTTEGFMKKVKEKYVEKFAKDVIILIEDKERLEKALETVNKYMERIEKGEVTAIKGYMKKRKRLEDLDDGDLD